MEGGIRDSVVIGVTVFLLAIGLFVIFFGVKATTSQLVEIPVIAEDTHVVEAFNGINTTINKLDYFIFGVFIALMIGFLISSWFVGGYPVLVIIYIIVIIVSVVLGGVLANVWETMAQGAIFGDTVSNFPITNNLLTNLPLYNLIIGALGMIVMFIGTQTKREY